MVTEAGGIFRLCNGRFCRIRLGYAIVSVTDDDAVRESRQSDPKTPHPLCPQPPQDALSGSGLVYFGFCTSAGGCKTTNRVLARPPGHGMTLGAACCEAWRAVSGKAAGQRARSRSLRSSDKYPPRSSKR